MAQIKQTANKMIEASPEDVSWEDLIHEFYVREKIEKAEAYVEGGGKTYSLDEARKILTAL